MSMAVAPTVGFGVGAVPRSTAGGVVVADRVGGGRRGGSGGLRGGVGVGVALAAGGEHDARGGHGAGGGEPAAQE